MVVDRVPSESELSSGPRTHALARLRRAGGLLTCNPERAKRVEESPTTQYTVTPPLILIAPSPGPLTTFSSLHIVRTTTRSVRPRSSRRNVPGSPSSARSLRLGFASPSRALRLRSREKGRRRASGARIRFPALLEQAFGVPRTSSAPFPLWAPAAVRDPQPPAALARHIWPRLTCLATEPSRQRVHRLSTSGKAGTFSVFRAG
jgi:hypothetical protein